MAFSVIAQTPEVGITEKWAWSSDVITSDDGTEQTISLARLPKRSFAGQFVFDSESDLRRHVATAFGKFKGTFDWPAWHMGVKLKAAASIGATSIYCNTARSDFRAGQKAILSLASIWEVVTIDEVFADHVTVAVATTKAWTARAVISPVLSVYSANNATVVRKNANHYAASNFQFFEYGFVSPFILDESKVDLTLFGAYPILNKRGIGTDFNNSFDTGMEVQDYGGQPSIRARWNNGQYVMPLTFKCPRGYVPLDWDWWRTFADYCRGSTNLFWLPTFRPDFEVYTAGAGGGNTVVIADTSYSEVYAGQETYNNIVFTKPDGTQHFAMITGVSTGSGRDTLTFTPALPGGSWAGHMLSFLLKCRIADDIVSTEHTGLNSLVTLNIRTVD